MLAEVKRWFVWGRAEQSASQYKWVIEPVGEGVAARASEFWRYRRVLWFLSVQNIKESYQGYTLGIGWLFVRPLMPILISTFIFGNLLNVPSDGLPYFLFFLAGQASWTVFERSLLNVTKSLAQGSRMLKKVYFPRLMAPISSMSISVVWFGIFTGLLILACVYYFFKDGVWYLRLGPQLLLAPLCVLASLVLSLGIGLFTAVWQLRFRETRYSIRYFTRFWSYLTPVIYPMSLVPPEHRWLIYLNPMAPLVETFKWSLFGVGTFPVVPLLSALGVIAIVLLAGLRYFSRMEASAVDRM
jgi:lipopolysaccharide transport system permease protein